MKVIVVGAGSWGTSIAALLAKKKYEVMLWARDPYIPEAIRKNRQNPKYLRDIRLPENLTPTDDLSCLDAALGGIVFAVPSHALRATIREAKQYIRRGTKLLSVVKGIEIESVKRMTEIMAEEMGDDSRQNICVLSGPNHAEEVSKEIPSATVVAAYNKRTALEFQEMFMTPYFRVYTNKDVIGVELGGATKNVIAIAAGISDGLGYGDNTKASLMTRGLAEMTRLGVTLGALPITFSGLAGIGDLIATCTSPHSRNRAVGEKLGKGKHLNEILEESTMVAEGILTCKAVLALAGKHGVEVPITRNVVEVLYQNKDPKDCVSDLMLRGATDEVKSAAMMAEDFE
jgi:glycerol-3-phosphate dehydrogenase (NAD(P)+)